MNQTPPTDNAPGNAAHFGGLDLLRAFAISLTLLYHYTILSHGAPAWLADAMQLGWTGVDLFFVLSGFLISSALFAELRDHGTFSYRRFFVKRSLRILPAFYTVAAIYFLVPAFREKPHLPPFWKLATFTQNFGLDLREAGAFSHGWSLCVEEHFYVLLPLSLWIFARRKKWNVLRGLLIALPFAGLACRYLSYGHLYMPHAGAEDAWRYWYKYVYYPSYNRLDGLCTGVGIAALYRFRPLVWEKIAHRSHWISIAGIVLLVAAYFLCIDHMSLYASVFGFPLVSLGYGCIVAGAICRGNALCRRFPKPVYWLAVLSYGIYLSHKGVIWMTRKALQDTALTENQTLLVCIGACIAAAAVGYLVVERPALRLRDRLLSRRMMEAQ